jgi:capsular exopolysaccharide synthesis family protein
MTIAEYLGILRRNLVWLVLLMVLGGTTAYLYSHTLPRQYRSFASVIVIPERGENTSEIVQGSNYVQNIVQSYALLATTPYVLQPVIDQLQLTDTPAQLATRIAVETPLNTVVIQVAVTDNSPEQAQRVAAAINKSLISAVSDLSPKIGNQPAVHLEEISPATLPQNYVAPDTRIYTLVGVLVGLALGVSIAFLRQQLRSRPSIAEDIEDFTDLPVLGEIPRLPRGTTIPKNALQNPDGPAAESLRALAASLRFVSVDNPANVIIVTSADPSDGKSSVAAGLGLTLAQTGHRTLVIDADLRNPSIAPLLGIEGGVGLTTVLLHDCAFQDAIQPWGHENLSILPGGLISPNPGQLVSSGQLGDTVSEARAEFDMVIVDTSPVMAVSDALWLTQLADGVLIVARARKTPIRRLRAAIDSVTSTRATIFGVVLNCVRLTSDSRYHGSYYGPNHMSRRDRLRRALPSIARLRPSTSDRPGATDPQKDADIPADAGEDPAEETTVIEASDPELDGADRSPSELALKRPRTS